MEINKQLFEDVLSGKLKGTFKLKNGFTVRSNRLFDSNSTNSYIYALKGFSTSFTALGKSSSVGYDIIDFIPDTDMKENKLTIEIPDGKIVDWDESKKQNKIIFKEDKKPLTYEDVCIALYKDKIVYYTNTCGYISKISFSDLVKDNSCDPNNATTVHQLECILAKNMLANVAVYLNDGWKPSNNMPAWTIQYDCYSGYHASSIQVGSIAFNSYGLVVFKSREFAEKAIEILGEETVKLALEPLGI